MPKEDRIRHLRVMIGDNGKYPSALYITFDKLRQGTQPLRNGPSPLIRCVNRVVQHVLKISVAVHRKLNDHVAAARLWL